MEWIAISDIYTECPSRSSIRRAFPGGVAVVRRDCGSAGGPVVPSRWRMEVVSRRREPPSNAALTSARRHRHVAPSPPDGRGCSVGRRSSSSRVVVVAHARPSTARRSSPARASLAPTRGPTHALTCGATRCSRRAAASPSSAARAEPVGRTWRGRSERRHEDEAPSSRRLTARSGV